VCGLFILSAFSFLVDQVVLDVLVNTRRKIVGVGHVHVGPPVDSNAIANGVTGGLLLYTGFSEKRAILRSGTYSSQGDRLNFPSSLFHSEKVFDGQLILAGRVDANNCINSELTISDPFNRNNLRFSDDWAPTFNIA
jgi:hypothetical protein